MTSLSKIRQPRLRASCDGCFQAKVKCSKTRPICTRCLSTGLDCHYSPSSRTGKPRSDMLANPGYSIAATAAAGYGMALPEEGNAEGVFMREQIQMQMFGQQEDTWGRGDTITDIYAMGIPWSPTGIPMAGLDAFPTQHPAPSSHARSLSLDLEIPQHLPKQWLDHPEMLDLSPYTLGSGTTSGIPSYFPQSTSTTSTTTSSSPTLTTGASTGSSTTTKPCSCFDPLAESLHELTAAMHIPTTQLQLNTILVVNKKAVTACAQMLGCSFCMVIIMAGSPAAPLTQRQVTVMLIGAVLGKCLGLYAAVVQGIGIVDVVMSTDGSAMTGGTPGGGVGRFPWGFVTRELQRVEEVLGVFEEMCNPVGEWSEVGGAISVYLQGVMRQTVGVFNIRKQEAGYPI